MKPISLVIPGNPVPMGRPRVGQHGAALPKRTAEAKDLIAKYTDNYWCFWYNSGTTRVLVAPTLPPSSRLREQEMAMPILSNWTDEEIAAIRECYAAAPGNSVVGLAELAERIGRPKTSICRVARKLGLTNQHRTLNDDARRAIGEAAVQRFEEFGHPRGMLGKHHTEENRALFAAALRSEIEQRTPEKRAAIRNKRVATNLIRYGKGAHTMTEKGHSRSQKGYCDDLPGIFFRSTWEANYARYLDWLKDQGEIKSWRYEPKAFIFHGVTRAPVTYTPDFEVEERDGSIAYHEVKGWMDSKSRGKLKRMAQFYPDVKIIIIAKEEYRSIAKWAGMIPFWGVAPELRDKQGESET